jgi:HSP20 family protein
MAIIKLKEPAYVGGSYGHDRSGTELNIFQNEMNRLFDRLMGRESQVSGVYPPVNVYQDKDNLYLTAELPGMKSSDIQIDAEEDGVHLKGNRKIKEEGQDVIYHRREREGGTFSRKLMFKTKIDTQKVSAELKDGVLKVTMPKAADTRPKKITIRSD